MFLLNLKKLKILGYICWNWKRCVVKWCRYYLDLAINSTWYYHWNKWGKIKNTRDLPSLVQVSIPTLQGEPVANPSLIFKELEPISRLYPNSQCLQINNSIGCITHNTNLSVQTNASIQPRENFCASLLYFKSWPGNLNKTHEVHVL